MTQKEYDSLIDDLIDLCFEIHSGNYYSDRCVELDDVLEVLDKHITVK